MHLKTTLFCFIFSQIYAQVGIILKSRLIRELDFFFLLTYTAWTVDYSICYQLHQAVPW